MCTREEGEAFDKRQKDNFNPISSASEFETAVETPFYFTQTIARNPKIVWVSSGSNTTGLRWLSILVSPYYKRGNLKGQRRI